MLINYKQYELDGYVLIENVNYFILDDSNNIYNIKDDKQIIYSIEEKDILLYDYFIRINTIYNSYYYINMLNVAYISQHKSKYTTNYNFTVNITFKNNDMLSIYCENIDVKSFATIYSRYFKLKKIV